MLPSMVNSSTSIASTSWGAPSIQCVRCKWLEHALHPLERELQAKAQEGSRKRRHKQFILVHPSSRATSSLLYPTSKESFTKSINCTITINHTILTPRKNQEHHWIIETTSRSPNQFSNNTRLNLIAHTQCNCSRIIQNYNETTQILNQTGLRKVEKTPWLTRQERPVHSLEEIQ